MPVDYRETIAMSSQQAFFKYLQAMPRCPDLDIYAAFFGGDPGDVFGDENHSACFLHHGKWRLASIFRGRHSSCSEIGVSPVVAVGREQAADVDAQLSVNAGLPSAC